MEISSYRNIWKVSYPIIAGSIAQNVINVVDTAFLGRLGPIALGAAGNSIIFYFVFIVLGMGLGIGGEIIVGRRNGEGNYKAIGRIVDHCFYALIPLAFLLFFFLNAFSSDILNTVTSDSDILEKSNEYMDIRIYGIFFAYANLGFRTFYIGITRTGILTWSTSFMALVNVIFDYLLIFGKFGFPEMGIKGAALASVIAEASATVYFLSHVIMKVDRKKYHLLFFQAFDKYIIRNVIKVSGPIMLQHFAAVISWLIFFLIIEKIGTRELAISHIIRSIYMVLLIPLFGFATATNTLVSNIIGMNRRNDVMPFVKKVALLTLGVTSLIIPFNLLIPDFMISIYTNDQSIIADSIPVLNIITAAMLLFSVTYILFSAVSGSGNTQMSLLIELTTLVLYLSATYYIGIVVKADLPIVWCSEFVYFSVMGILSFLYLKYGNWQKKEI